jgi:uncharacterized damage-inducible protein DinB
MSPRAAPLGALLRLNTHLLLNCFDQVTDGQAMRRVVPQVNSMAFLAAHLIDTRHELLSILGAPGENPVRTHLANARSIDDVADLPTLAELLSAWRQVASAIDQRLTMVDDAMLDAPSGRRFPGGDPSTVGALAFLVQHDSYHIGQLAMLRRVHGLPAMRYSIAR